MANSAQTSAGARPVSRRNGSLWRLAPSVVAGLVACGLVLALAFDFGGYFPERHLAIGAFAFGTLALLLAVRPPDYTLSIPTLVAVGSLAALAVWTGLSSLWSSTPDTAIEDFQRVLVYLAIFGLGVLAGGTGRFSRHLIWAVLLTTTIIVGAGLVSRLYPDVISARGTISEFDDFRLAYPLGYWNAFGTLAVMGLVLATGLAADRRQVYWARGLAAAATVPLGAAGYLSFSRGAWLALGVGIVLLVVLAARRLHLLVSMSIVGGALTLAVLRLRAYPALTDDPAIEPGQLASGHAYGGLLIGLAVAAGAAQAAAAWIRMAPHTKKGLEQIARRVGPAVAVVAVIAAGIAYATAGGAAEGRSAKELDRASSWVDRQWDEFMAPATFSARGTERLKSARGTRSDLYRVAIDGFEGNPLLGDGSGGFEVRFARDREVPEKVRDAHSLYFETLGELGLVGIALLLVFIGALVWGVVAARVRRQALGRSQTAAAGAALGVWIFHTGVDWDWQMPALTGTALLLAAACSPEGRSSRRVRRARS